MASHLLLVSAGLALAAANAATGAAANETPVWSVVESSSTHLSIAIIMPAARWLPAEGGGRFEVDGFPARDETQGVALPSLRLPVAVPLEGSIRVSASLNGVEALARDRTDLAPAPDNGPAAEWLAADDMGVVEYLPPSQCADLRILSLRVHPITLDRAGGLVAVRRADVRIDFAAGGDARRGRGTPTSPGRAARPTARLTSGGPYGDVVINPAQAQAWRANGERRTRLQRGDSFGSATSPWLRISIEKRGVYQLTAADLEAAGIDPNDIDLTQLRLFCGPAGALSDTTDVFALAEWMEPCAIHVVDDGDGRWDDATRVCFLGNGPDGWRDDLGLPSLGDADRYYVHPSANHFDYWLCWGGEFTTAPRWMDAVDADPGQWPLRMDAPHRVHVERNTFYDSRPRDPGGAWPRYFDFSVSASLADVGASISVELPGVISSAGAALRASMWGASWGVDGLANDHYARVRVNGETLADVWWEGVRRKDVTGAIASPAVNNQVALYVPHRFDSSDQVIGDKVYFDWVEVDYRRLLAAVDDSIAFSVSIEEAASHGVRITGLTQAEGWLLLDASSPREPVRLLPRVTAAGSTFMADFEVHPQGDEARIVLVRLDRAARPPAIARVTFPEGRLRARTAPVDYLIVTTDELRPAAQVLGRHRSANFYGAKGDTSGAGEVAIVDIQQVFDEFGYGQRDPVALRDFLDFARQAWDDPDPGYRLTNVLFLGDAYEDPRNYRSGDTRDLVPSHEQYDWVHQTSQSWIPGFWGDDWFAFLDGPGDSGLDLAIGRLPAANLQQALHMVRKTIAIEAAPTTGDWKTRLVFAADDICQGNETDGLNYAHMVQSELLVSAGAPEEAQVAKLYLYEYGSECRYERKPEATADLMTLFEEGTIIFNFVGHGSEIQVADERLLDNSSIASVSNAGKPFFMITASCAVGRFTHGGSGLALQALRMEDRGAVGVVSASSSASSSLNYNLNLHVLQRMFRDRDLHRTRSFGPSFLQAKVLDASSNDRRYNLLGDPGARFAVPRYSLDLRLEGVPGVSAGADTLIRGAGALLRGQVKDLEGGWVTSFSGTADLLVLDSDIHRSPVTSMPSRDYELPGARIFSGRVPVTNGEFACPFFVPTALRLGVRGPARIYAYAHAGESDGAADGSGALTDIFIPEKKETVPADTVGPVIDLAWLAPGDMPATGSELTATFVDASGIYVAALAPSRSVVLTIADADKRILVADDLAGQVVFGDDYRQAQVGYALPAGLPVGEPLTLAVEASDNLGRRSRAEMPFTVGVGDEAARGLLLAVYNIPNPAETGTRFLVELDREADLEITLYTVAGRRILRLPAERFTRARAREVGIYWDGHDDDGDPLANGTYFYRVVGRDAAGKREERIERLVVLR